MFRDWQWLPEYSELSHFVVVSAKNTEKWIAACGGEVEELHAR